MTDLLALTEQLCAVPSVSGEERALADFVEARLREHAAGLEIERVGENVVARTRRGAATRILLGGHLDTVPANGNATPLVASVIVLGVVTLGIGGYIAYAGGKIRHREFRNVPPPPRRSEEESR